MFLIDSVHNSSQKDNWDISQERCEKVLCPQPKRRSSGRLDSMNGPFLQVTDSIQLCETVIIWQSWMWLINIPIICYGKTFIRIMHPALFPVKGLLILLFFIFPKMFNFSNLLVELYFCLIFFRNAFFFLIIIYNAIYFMTCIHFCYYG